MAKWSSQLDFRFLICDFRLACYTEEEDERARIETSWTFKSRIHRKIGVVEEEADELVATMTASRKSAASNQKSKMTGMQLTREQIQQLIAHARRDAPNEACGIIGGKDHCARKIYPLKNTHATPRVNFYADPSELYAALCDIEANGWEHLAIYHSHCATEAYPSETDIARAYYPDAIYLLISLANPEQIVVRGFRIAEGKVIEITLEVEDDETSRTHQRRAARRTGRPHTRRAVAALSRR